MPSLRQALCHPTLELSIDAKQLLALHLQPAHAGKHDAPSQNTSTDHSSDEDEDHHC